MERYMRDVERRAAAAKAEQAAWDTAPDGTDPAPAPADMRDSFDGLLTAAEEDALAIRYLCRQRGHVWRAESDGTDSCRRCHAVRT